MSFEEAFVQHAHRDSNFYADILAKEGHNLLTPFSLYISSPAFVVSQLLTDIWGVSYSCKLLFRLMQFPFHQKKKKTSPKVQPFNEGQNIFLCVYNRISILVEKKKKRFYQI